MEDKPIKDSGGRREFSTGAQRDLAEGKGRFDLISPIFSTRLATNKIENGDTDEDHAAAIACNIMFFIHTKEMIDRGLLPKELDDLPSYTPKETLEYISTNDERLKSSTCEPTPDGGEVTENFIRIAPNGHMEYRRPFDSEYKKLFNKKLAQLVRKTLTKLPPIKEVVNKKLKEIEDYWHSFGSDIVDEYPHDDDEGFSEDDYPANNLVTPTMEDYKFATKPRIKAYLSHPIRGSKGKDATDEEMKANLDDAIKICEQLRAGFPELDIYCPAEKDEALAYLLKNNYVTVEQLLEADCSIIDRMDLVLYYTADVGLFGGMLVEHSHACSKNIPGRYFSKINDSIIAQIDSFISARQEKNSG